MIDYINIFQKESDYVSEKSSIEAVGSSSTSLVEKENIVHYDGVNVAVKVPKQGDAVYVPTTSVYSAATPDSGVTEGSVTFVAGGTINDSLMSAKGMTSIGTVVMVRGKKCYVMFKNIGNEQKFYYNATSGDGGFPPSKLSDSDLAKITAGDAKDTQGLVGYRATCSVEVLYAWLTGRGGASKNEGWNGGTNGLQNDFLNGADWGLTLGPASSSITAHDATTYKVAETIAKFGSGDAGFKKYLESRRLAYPCSLASNSVLFQDGKAATKILADANESDNSAYFLPAQFAYNHNYTWGSYGNFANVDGLRRGDWFMPGLEIVQAMFRNVKYTLESTPTDAINVTQNAIGGSKLQLNTNTNASRYWLPFVRSRSNGWFLNSTGNFYGDGALNSAFRALSVALVNL